MEINVINYYLLLKTYKKRVGTILEAKFVLLFITLDFLTIIILINLTVTYQLIINYYHNYFFY